MAPPYLTAAQAAARLTDRFALSDHALADAYVAIASDEVDAEGPFSGLTYSPIQGREFPRTHVALGDEVGVVPDAVLDFVALRAAHLSQPSPAAPIQSHSVGEVSRTYASPKRERLDVLLLASLRSLDKYRRKTGVMV
ncbi:MAG: hypothetical protein M3R38_22165 [Actinomycetota bacterium]|nr:hypothetical protein [Actinomycetota bacterium]